MPFLDTSASDVPTPRNIRRAPLPAESRGPLTRGAEPPPGSRNVSILMKRLPSRVELLLDLALKLPDLGVQAAQRLDSPASQARLQRGLRGEQSFGRREARRRVEPRDGALVAEAERDEVEVQPVDGACPLREQLPAVVTEQLQVALRRACHAGGSSSRAGARAIASASRGSLSPPPRNRRRCRSVSEPRTSTTLLAFGEQEAGHPASDPAAAFDPEALLARRQRCHPGEQCPMGPSFVSELALGEFAAGLVDQNERRVSACARRSRS
jgi:hypothetical protein